MNKLAELRRPDLEAALTTKRSFDTANGFNVGLKRSRPKPDVNVGVNAVSKVTTKQKILDSAFQVLLEEAPYSSLSMIELWRRLYMVGGGVSNLLLVMTLSGRYT
jgi:hypothetical protein